MDSDSSSSDIHENGVASPRGDPKIFWDACYLLPLEDESEIFGGIGDDQEDGEELFSDNMEADYRLVPDLDLYDLDVDDLEFSSSPEEEQAAEEEMRSRDREEGIGLGCMRQGLLYDDDEGEEERPVQRRCLAKMAAEGVTGDEKSDSSSSDIHENGVVSPRRDPMFSWNACYLPPFEDESELLGGIGDDQEDGEELFSDNMEADYLPILDLDLYDLDVDDLEFSSSSEEEQAAEEEMRSRDREEGIGLGCMRQGLLYDDDEGEEERPVQRRRLAKMAAEGVTGDEKSQRERHNLQEKKRRNDIKDSFEELKRIMPGFKRNKKRVTQQQILLEACKFLKQNILKKMNDEEARLEEENRLIEQSLADLEKAVANNDVETVAKLSSMDFPVKRRYDWLENEDTDSDDGEISDEDGGSSPPQFSVTPASQRKKTKII